MMRSILAATAALAFGMAGSAASAATYLVQFDDTPGALIGATYRDGVTLEIVDLGTGGYDQYYGLPNGALLADFAFNFNIYEPGGLVPSDTWSLIGRAGNSVLEFNLQTDTNGVVPKPLSGAASVFETGDWQTLAVFTVSNGDQYTWQFRSDFGSVVPEPGVWALMIVGFAGVGAALRGQRRRLRLA